MAKMGCRPNQRLAQRTGQPDETEEEVVQDSDQSDHSVQVPDSEEVDQQVPEDHSQAMPEPSIDTKSGERKQKIRWPPNNNKADWDQFDFDVDSILNTSLAGGIDKKVEAMATIMYNVGKERFGLEEVRQKQQKSTGHRNRRQQERASIRRDLRQLSKRYRVAPEEERAALAELRQGMRERLKILNRAERSRKRRKERARARARFTANPFQFTSKLLGKKSSGKLLAEKAEVENHLKEVHSDEKRDEELSEQPKLIQVCEPEHIFDESEPTAKEVRDVIQKARAASAPGPNGIPYKVYKNCPRLTRRLWKHIRVIWRRGRLADSWNQAEGCYIPKEENSKNLSQFRTISLLNVEGKILLSVMANRMTRYMLDNNYVDIAVQKGGVPGVSGCIEHTSVLTQIIREAREGKGELAVIWLDLANAYGSMPHKLVQLTLEKYHVPAKTRHLLEEYFNRLELRFSIGDYTTSWQRLEVGIVTGCTISVILFAAAMNLLVKSTEKMSRGPWMRAGIRQPPVRAFMDDMTISTKTAIEARWTLKEIEELISWARMKIKPSKSRSLVLKKGRVTNYDFQLGQEIIPSVSEKPVKCLGKYFDDTLRDTKNTTNTVEQLQQWMEAIDKSGLPGKYKTWIYQHGVLPRILWPLQVYDVPMSRVEAMERLTTKFLRRWLAIPQCFSSVGLYSVGTKLQLPLSSLVEEYKVTKVRQHLTLRDSKDEKVRGARVNLEAGRKWSVQDTVREAELRLKQADIVGNVAVGRLGLGTITSTRWRTAGKGVQRKLVQKEVRVMEEDSRMVKAVGMKKQGSWMNWEAVRQRKVTWNDIWSMEPNRLQFLLRSVYDVLPSPTNLAVWGLTEDPNCKLCGKPANLEHILSSCSVALSEGRYTWRHDQILSVLADSLEKARKRPPPKDKRLKFINFVRAGEREKTGSTGEGRGLLGTAGDWQMRADLKTRMQFPTEVASTNKRPDIVIWSPSSRQVIIVELTVPWEERMEDAYERKMGKYQELVADCQERGWRVWCFPVEVGTRGFVGQSLWRALRVIGVIGLERRQLIGRLSREAEIASLWLWRRREGQWGRQ